MERTQSKHRLPTKKGASQPIQQKDKNVAPKTQPKLSRKKSTSAAGGSKANRDICLYWNEAEDITKWMQCQKCEMWAHYECAGVDDTVFNWLCEFCE